MAACGAKEGLEDNQSGGCVGLYAEGRPHAHQHSRWPEPEHNFEYYMMHLKILNMLFICAIRLSISTHLSNVNLVVLETFADSMYFKDVCLHGFDTSLYTRLHRKTRSEHNSTWHWWLGSTGSVIVLILLLQKEIVDHDLAEQMEEPMAQQLEADINALVYNKQQLALRAKATIHQ
ncbi:hypothetical protein CFC21_066143 [Triticum aestivum]|uniref:Uncharacterized protein n=2 Tax=Triticum aestivum TaxID=4565 RepID=A0A3B6KJJ1_WHEAT|nr:hypothetical protein CFC21_066143 [Triticum aestivum]